MPKVAVVILNWNGSQLLQQFIPSIIENTTYENAEIWVADNASTDDSLGMLKKKFPNVLVTINNGNLGYAGGYNEALKNIDADYYVLLNSDVEVTNNWIKPVIDLMETDKAIAAAQPKIRAYNNKKAFEYAGAAGGFIDKLGYPFCRGRVFDTFEEDNNQYNDAKEVFWASGACLFIKKECFVISGGLDVDFFAHMEEIDLCWRLKNMGYKIMYCPDSLVYHVGGGTLQAGSPRKTYLNFRNNRIMLLKNLPFGASFKIYLVRNCLDTIAILQALISGFPKGAWAIFKAVAYIHLKFPYWLKRKKEIQILTEQHSIGPINKSGIFNGSIVFNYFLNNKKTYKQISEK